MLRLATAWIAVTLAVAPANALAEDEASPPGSAAASASAPAPVYKLPKVGKPRGRIGGGRRGPLAASAELRALAPDHVGRTTSEQPSLYWYVAEPVPGDVVLELTLVDDRAIDPLVDRRLGRPAAAGLQRVRLAELGVTLDPDQEYQWSVAVVPDPEDRSKDIVASGWLQRVAAPEALAERLEAAGPRGAAAVYGEAGLWYDMLDAAFEQIRAHPDAEGLREDLATVLEQAGLPREAALRRP